MTGQMKHITDRTNQVIGYQAELMEYQAELIKKVMSNTDRIKRTTVHVNSMRQSNGIWFQAKFPSRLAIMNLLDW